MAESPRIAAIIPAAGVGKRMNAPRNKVWLQLAGKSMIEHTLDVFQTMPGLDLIVLVVHEAEFPAFHTLLAKSQDGFIVPVVITAGGAERQDSVYNGLRYLEQWSEWQKINKRKIVMIHDAARALVTREILQQSVMACREYRAVGVGVPVKDTIKQATSDGFIAATPDRSLLWAIQTPQVFDFDLILQCHRQVAGYGSKFSDDCGIVETCGHPVKLVLGSYENIKLTTPEDLDFAEAIVRRRANANRAGI